MDIQQFRGQLRKLQSNRVQANSSIPQNRQELHQPVKLEFFMQGEAVNDADGDGIGRLVSNNFNNSMGASRQRRKRNQLYFSLNSTGQENQVQTKMQTGKSKLIEAYEYSSSQQKQPQFIDQVVINGDLVSPNIKYDRETLGSVGSLLKDQIVHIQNKSTISNPNVTYNTQVLQDQSKEYLIQSPMLINNSNKRHTYSSQNQMMALQPQGDPIRLKNIGMQDVIKTDLQNEIQMRQQRLLQSQYQAFGNQNAPKLIKQFVETQESIGFKQKSLKQHFMKPKDPEFIDKIIKDSYKTLIQVGNRKDNLKQIYGKFLRPKAYFQALQDTSNNDIFDKNSSEITIQNQLQNITKIDDQEMFQHQVVRNKILKDNQSPMKISYGSVLYSKHRSNFSEVDFSSTLGKKSNFMLDNQSQVQLKQQLLATQQPRQSSLQSATVYQQKIMKKSHLMNLSTLKKQEQVKALLRSERLDSNSTYRQEYQLMNQKKALMSPAPVKSNIDILSQPHHGASLSPSHFQIIEIKPLNIGQTKTLLQDNANIIEASSRRRKYKKEQDNSAFKSNKQQFNPVTTTSTIADFNITRSQFSIFQQQLQPLLKNGTKKQDYKSMLKTNYMGFKIPDLQQSLKLTQDNLQSIKVDQLRSLKQGMSIEQKLSNISKSINLMTTEKKKNPNDAESKFYNYVSDRIEMMSRMASESVRKKRSPSTENFLS